MLRRKKGCGGAQLHNNSTSFPNHSPYKLLSVVCRKFMAAAECNLSRFAYYASAPGKAVKIIGLLNNAGKIMGDNVFEMFPSELRKHQKA